MINAEYVELLAVRIEIKKCENWDVIGSGVLWIPEDESEYVYIFTAGHVVKDYIKSEYDICVSYYNQDRIVASSVINKDDIKVHENYKDNGENELKDYDAAVLRSKDLMCNKIIYNINSHENKKMNEKLILNGFPDSLKNKDFENHINLYYGSYYKHIKQKREFRYKLDEECAIDPIEKNKDLVGISGSGIFIDDNGYFHLIGVHTGGLGDNVNFNNVAGVGIKYFIDICKVNFYDVPKLSSEIDGVLYKYFNKFKETITNEDIISTMYDIIDSDFSNIINLDFCDHSKKCEYQEFYHKCDTFRFNLLLIITLIKYFNPEISLLEMESKICNLKFRFICSEGAIGDSPPINMISFIKAINEDYLNRRSISEESLVIWGSGAMVTGNLEVLEDSYKKNIYDIYLSRPDNRFHILHGRGRPSKLRILCIEQVIKNINEKNMNELSEYMTFK